MVAILGKDGKIEKEKGQEEDSKDTKLTGDIKNELDFADWYQPIEEDLLDASHEEYTSVAFFRW